jgi:hypothetical protein
MGRGGQKGGESSRLDRMEKQLESLIKEVRASKRDRD